MSAILRVLSQHVEEAAMLWLLRCGATAAPHYGLADLDKLDSRVEAHLDGLRIAGGDAWPIVEEQLGFGEPGEVFVASLLAFEARSESRIKKVLEVVTAEPALAEGMISALGWMPFEQAVTFIKRFLEAGSPVLHPIGLAGCAVHRQNPEAFMAEPSMGDDPLLNPRAPRAVGELGRVDLAGRLRPFLSAEHEDVRFSAAWSAGLLTGDSQALAILKAISEGGGILSEKALQVVVRQLSLAEAKSWQKKLSQNPAGQRLAILAAGAIGDPEVIPWLIEQMKILPLARPAGEAFTTITGIDLAYRDLERKPPEEFQSGPTEDAGDENVEMDPDDNLPWPEPTLVQKWWEQHGREFRSGTRHLLGKPIAEDWLKTVLRDGRQRQRAAAALELAIRQPKQPLFNVAAPGFRQIQLLGKPGPPIR